MKDFNNDQFNKGIKEKFKDIKFEPTEAVWDAIEADLLRAENKKVQKKAMWYRNIATTVILIALVSIYFNVIDRFSIDFSGDQLESIILNDSCQLTFNNNNIQTNTVTVPKIINDVLPSSKSSSNQDTFSKSSVSNQKSSNFESNFGINQVNTQAPIALNDNFIFNRTEVEDLGVLSKIGFKPFTEGEESTAKREELKKVSFFAISELEKKPEKNDRSLQANVMFGSGNFNPNASVSEGNSVPASAIVSNIASRNPNSNDSQSERQLVEDLSNAPMRSNLSLTYGVNLGVNLTDRLVVKSGINYGRYRSTSESSAVLRDINSDKLYPYHGASSAASAAEGKVINITSPYNLFNDFEILSVPIQLNYKLIDSKFGIALMAGATADFLLSNTITGASDQLSSITFSQHDKNAYKNVFASGIVGLELSYALGSHYGITLTPQYKKALTDVTNSGVRFKSAPAFASVNMSFQYIF